MPIRGKAWRLGAVQLWAYRLLLVAFAVRSLVPVGFMPDFTGAAHGVVKIVICSAYAQKTIAVDADGKPVQDKPSPHHDAPCAFAGLVHLAVAAADGVVSVALEPVRAPLFVEHAAALPPARTGPPLGSRGPPQIS